MTTLTTAQTAALRFVEDLARNFATTWAPYAAPLSRKEIESAVDSVLCGEFGVFRAACDKFEHIWTTAGGEIE